MNSIHKQKLTSWPFAIGVTSKQLDFSPRADPGVKRIGLQQR